LVRHSLTLCTEQLETWRGKAVLKFSWQTVRQWAGFLLLDLLLAGLVLLLLAHWPRQVLFLSRGSEHPEWLNVTPGYPDRVPLISLLRYSPWPLPSEHNFSAILSLSIKGDEPVLLKGRPNQVRYWSFVFYPAGAAKHDRDLPALDSSTVQLEQDGSYIVTLSPTPQGKNWLSTRGASGGILFMRNYLPETSARLMLPAVYRGERLVVAAKEYDHVP
jgi:hypothetical protein